MRWTFTMRRAWQSLARVARHSIQDSLAGLTGGISTANQIPLWDPAAGGSERWELMSDRAIGGKSICAMDYRSVNDDKQEAGDAAVFSGNTSLATTGKMSKSGYCAARFTLPPRSQDLGEYAGLEMRLKTDGRMYTVNIQCDTWFEDDLYQGFVLLPKDEWVTVELPFDDFLLTTNGYMRTEQRSLEPSSISTISMCIGTVDRTEGPFEIQCQWIKVRTIKYETIKYFPC